MANKSRNLELLSREHFQGRVEAHEQIITRIFVKYPDERLFELRRRKAVRKKHMTTGVIHQVLHFQKPDLVKAASKYINDMTIVRSALGKAIVELSSLVPTVISLALSQPTLTAFLKYLMLSRSMSW